MKKLFLVSIIVLVGITSCDKVDNAYPVLPATDLDYSLFPGGDSAAYAATEWPTFIVNGNINRNIVIEDFTGHTCIFCPAAAAEAENIESLNPGRVFISTIHTSEIGIGDFQEAEATGWFTRDFTCSEGLDIGVYFGEDWSGSAFTGNPKGTVSRILDGIQPTMGPAQWSPFTNAALAANDLKVNIQTETNFYPTERGLFVHAEIDVLDAALTNDLNIVVQLHEDSIISPQKFPGGTFPDPDPFDHIDTNYVHHDVLRACIDGRPFGQLLDDNHLDANGNYYFNYSYKLPNQYDPTNMHLLIYVRDAVTEEIYQVIEHHFN